MRIKAVTEVVIVCGLTLLAMTMVCRKRWPVSCSVNSLCESPSMAGRGRRAGDDLRDARRWRRRHDRGILPVAAKRSGRLTLYNTAGNWR